jgi:DNA polymerase alpha subunit B
MYEKVSERSEGTVALFDLMKTSVNGTVALDDRIDEFAELVREHYNLDDLGDPNSSADVCVYFVFQLLQINF